MPYNSKAMCLLITTLGPIQEELLFRALLQPLLSYSIVWLIPATGAPLFGSVLNVATSISIVATGLFFGFAHSHQVELKAVSGIALGVLAACCGLPASIAAHMTINTAIETIKNLFAGDKIDSVVFD